MCEWVCYTSLFFNAPSMVCRCKLFFHVPYLSFILVHIQCTITPPVLFLLYFYLNLRYILNRITTATAYICHIIFYFLYIFPLLFLNNLPQFLHSLCVASPHLCVCVASLYVQGHCSSEHAVLAFSVACVVCVSLHFINKETIHRERKLSDGRVWNVGFV